MHSWSATMPKPTRTGEVSEPSIRIFSSMSSSSRFGRGFYMYTYCMQRHTCGCNRVSALQGRVVVTCPCCTLCIAVWWCRSAVRSRRQSRRAYVDMAMHITSTSDLSIYLVWWLLRRRFVCCEATVDRGVGIHHRACRAFCAARRIELDDRCGADGLL